MAHVPVTKTIEDPRDKLLFDRDYFDSQATLKCPVCGDIYSHAVGVYTLIGGDESDGLLHGSYLVARQTPYRRDAIAVRFRGETCTHRWDVVFQQHKGNTFVRVDVLKDDTTAPGADV